MKKKKFITPKVRVIKLEAEELLAASELSKFNLSNGTNDGQIEVTDIEEE